MKTNFEPKQSNTNLCQSRNDLAISRLTFCFILKFRHSQSQSALSCSDVIFLGKLDNSNLNYSTVIISQLYSKFHN